MLAEVLKMEDDHRPPDAPGPRERFTRTMVTDRWALDVQEMNARHGRRRLVLRVTLFAEGDVVGYTMLVESLTDEARARIIRALGGRP